MNAEKAIIILTALIELSPESFLEELYDQGIDAMREYETFLAALEAVRDWIREKDGLERRNNPMHNQPLDDLEA